MPEVTTAGWASVSDAAARVPEREAAGAAAAEEERLAEEGIAVRSPGSESLNVTGIVPEPSPGTLGRAAHDLDMRVAALYSARGFQVQRTPQNSRVLTGLRTGAVVEQADLEAFVRLCSLVRPRRIFGVGNAFGYSTFALSFACNNAPMDVVDAGTEGLDNLRGVELTRTIALEEGRDVQVHVGLSPHATPAALRGPNGTYDLALIDGYHSDRHLVADFLGVRRAMSDRAVAIFHDVGWFHMWAGVRKVLRVHPAAKYRTYEGRWAKNRLGTGFAYWGFPPGTFEDFGPLLQVPWHKG